MSYTDSIFESKKHIFHTMKRTSTKRLIAITLGVFISVLLTIQIVYEISTFEIVNKILPGETVPGYVKSKELDSLSNSPEFKESANYTEEYLLSLPLLERLRIVYPYSINNSPLPKIVTQSYKDKNIALSSNLVRSWYENEPDFTHYIYDDRELYRLLLRNFGVVFPEIIETFNNLPRNILRFDFFRYCALFLNGGIYTDIDTEKTKPFEQWISFNKTLYGEENTLGMVTGIEGECDCEDWKGIFARRVQLCQWTMQSKPHHPVFAILINSIVNSLDSYDKNTKTWTKDGVKYDFRKGEESYYTGIMEMTGPPAYTDAVFTYINSLSNPRIRNFNDISKTWEATTHKNPENKELSYGHGPNINLGWENLTHIKEPLIVEDVLLFPEAYFNGKKDRDTDVSVMLVSHQYHGSWKSANSDKRASL